MNYVNWRDIEWYRDRYEQKSLEILNDNNGTWSRIMQSRKIWSIRRISSGDYESPDWYVNWTPVVLLFTERRWIEYIEWNCWLVYISQIWGSVDQKFRIEFVSVERNGTAPKRSEYFLRFWGILQNRCLLIVTWTDTLWRKYNTNLKK